MLVMCQMFQSRQEGVFTLMINYEPYERFSVIEKHAKEMLDIRVNQVGSISSYERDILMCCSLFKGIDDLGVGFIDIRRGINSQAFVALLGDQSGFLYFDLKDIKILKMSGGVNSLHTISRDPDSDMLSHNKLRINENGAIV